MAITIKKANEIAKLSVANKIVAKTLEHLTCNVHPGMSLKELNAMGHVQHLKDFMVSQQVSVPLLMK